MAIHEDIQENMRRGLTEMLLLNLLRESDQYGYQLLQELNERTSGVFNVTLPSLYGPLYRFLSKGYVTETRVAAGQKRFRNYYHLTEAGEAYYQMMVTEYKRTYLQVNKMIGWDGDRP